MINGGGKKKEKGGGLRSLFSAIKQNKRIDEKTSKNRRERRVFNKSNSGAGRLRGIFDRLLPLIAAVVIVAVIFCVAAARGSGNGEIRGYYNNVRYALDPKRPDKDLGKIKFVSLLSAINEIEAHGGAAEFTLPVSGRPVAHAGGGLKMDVDGGGVVRSCGAGVVTAAEYGALTKIIIRHPGGVFSVYQAALIPGVAAGAKVAAAAPIAVLTGGELVFDIISGGKSIAERLL